MITALLIIFALTAVVLVVGFIDVLKEPIPEWNHESGSLPQKSVWESEIQNLIRLEVYKHE
jgi:hypothetical protein